MGIVRQIDIKNRSYYFYNDMINIKKFDSNLLKSTKNHINPLYLTIAHASGYIERSSAEEKGVNKYLVFDSTDENKELLKKYNDVFNGIRNKIKKISGDECDYEKIT